MAWIEGGEVISAEAFSANAAAASISSRPCAIKLIHCLISLGNGPPIRRWPAVLDDWQVQCVSDVHHVQCDLHSLGSSICDVHTLGSLHCSTLKGSFAYQNTLDRRYTIPFPQKPSKSQDDCLMRRPSIEVCELQRRCPYTTSRIL